MKPHTPFVVLLSALLVNQADAKCVYHPEIRSSVTIDRCVAVTFGAADVKYTFGSPQFDPWPLNKPGDTLSGTLLTVSIKKSHFTWSDAMGHYTNGMHLWKKGESYNLFVRAPPSNVCPPVLPADHTVQSLHVCCDSGGWECLLPPTIPLVTLVTEKSGK
jgi:hypothetical protein